MRNNQRECGNMLHPLLVQQIKQDFSSIIDPMLDDSSSLLAKLEPILPGVGHFLRQVSAAYDHHDSNLRSISDKFEQVSQLLKAEIALHQEVEKISVRETESRLTISNLLTTSLSNMPVSDQMETMLGIIFSIPWFTLLPKGGIFLTDAQTGDLVLMAHRGFCPLQTKTCARISSGQCLCGKVLQSGQTVFASNIDERHDITFDGMTPHGHYCVPIKEANRVIGVINLYVPANHSRHPQEEEFLNVVSITLTGLIQRHKLQGQIKSIHDALVELGISILYDGKNVTYE